jgi:hypothetical protein
MDRDMKRFSIVFVALFAILGAVSCTTTTVSQSDGSDAPHADDQEIKDLLHEPGAATRAITDIAEAVGVSPAQVTGVDVYGDYMIVEAQDPNAPDHIDQYTWRDGEVQEPPTPVHLSGPQDDTEALLFPTTGLDFDDLPGFVRDAEARLQRSRPTPIEEALASYLSIERSSSLDGRITVRIYISGPRRSGNVEVTTSGEVVAESVS